MNQKENKKKKFSTIVLKHFSALKRFAASLCKNNFDADDLVSETILKAYENFVRVKDESKIKQWLFRILNNQFISNYRSRKNFVEIASHENEYSHGNLGTFSLFEAIAKSDFVEAGNPEKKFISKLTQKQIEKAVGELPEEFRAALILCDMEDFSYAEISQILKAPIGTVRSRIARARKILQKKLWLQAQELGIKASKNPKEKTGYTCTCGEEEILPVRQTGKIAITIS
ncbi:MAG: RNA polymerase sigma factor [Bacteroidetes bacterium]|nr:RNA polymerase sigma factor [Bacteroidota bacterium]